MTADNLRDLFVHDLEDIYYAEREHYDALGDMADQVGTDEIAETLREHREETAEHVDRLEEIFEMVGHEVEREECEGIEGLLEEHEEFVDTDPDGDVLDVHTLVAAQKLEHYEIAAYGNLALLADRLGEEDAGDRLHQTLEEEEDSLDELTRLIEEYDFDAVRQSASAD